MAKKVFMLFLGILCISGGCRYWYQEGNSFDQAKQDRTECLRELQKYADMGSIQSYETGFMKSCMRCKGYRLVGEGTLPMTVKREDPQMTTFWLIAGVAGELDSTSD